MTSTPLCEFVGLLVSPTGVINNLTLSSQAKQDGGKKRRKKEEKRERRQEG
jgi:hypothetical protein